MEEGKGQKVKGERTKVKDERTKEKAEGQKVGSREGAKVRCRGTDAAVDLVHWVE